MGISVFENWNRYYDPYSGRYLQPEPLLMDPWFVANQAQHGRAPPTYSYANNNPVYYADPDGRLAGPLDFIARRLIPYLTPFLPPLFPWESSDLGDGTPNASYPPSPSPAPAPSPSPTPTPSPAPSCKGGNNRDGDDPCDSKLSPWQLKQADLKGKEHSVKHDYFGKRAPISQFDLCGCRDGRVVIKARGCRGDIITETEYRWK